MASTVDALKIIESQEITSPRQFGRLLWPDHPGWKRYGKAGNGSAAGVGMNLTSGAFLGRLVRKGYVRLSFGSRGPSWSLTTLGEAKLKEGK